MGMGKTGSRVDEHGQYATNAASQLWPLSATQKAPDLTE
jgi:hypothetical protein